MYVLAYKYKKYNGSYALMVWTFSQKQNKKMFNIKNVILHFSIYRTPLCIFFLRQKKKDQ